MRSRGRSRNVVGGGTSSGLGRVAEHRVLAARFRYLTTREHNRFARQQARVACAAALLRWLHVVVTQRVVWDPAIAAGRKALEPAA